MPAITHLSSHAATGVNRLVPYVHVADIHASLAFCALLGFTPQNTMSDSHGRPFWSLARSGAAEIMFALATGPVDAAQQAVLFYMYAEDVAAIRRHLLASGVRDGGVYSGRASPDHGPRMAFSVAYPRHMSAGELRVTDPDGYSILVGQLQELRPSPPAR